MYAESYKQTGMSSIHQSDLEAHTLIKAASRLNRIKENWDALAKTELADTLESNRKLWTILSSEMADMEHPLPHEVRESIANLAMFIFKHTIKVMAEKEPKPQDLDVLININMNVAKGLSEGLRAEQERKAQEAREAEQEASVPSADGRHEDGAGGESSEEDGGGTDENEGSGGVPPPRSSDIIA